MYRDVMSLLQFLQLLYYNLNFGQVKNYVGQVKIINNLHGKLVLKIMLVPGECDKPFTYIFWNHYIKRKILRILNAKKSKNHGTLSHFGFCKKKVDENEKKKVIKR